MKRVNLPIVSFFLILTFSLLLLIQPVEAPYYLWNKTKVTLGQRVVAEKEGWDTNVYCEISKGEIFAIIVQLTSQFDSEDHPIYLDVAYEIIPTDRVKNLGTTGSSLSFDHKDDLAGFEVHMEALTAGLVHVYFKYNGTYWDDDSQTFLELPLQNFSHVRVTIAERTFWTNQTLIITIVGVISVATVITVAFLKKIRSRRVNQSSAFPISQ